MYVFGQNESVHQTLSDTTPFAFIPYSYTSGRGEGFVVKLKRRLPFRHDSEGGHHVCPSLGRQLLDNNTSQMAVEEFSWAHLLSQLESVQPYAISSENGLKEVEDEVLDYYFGTLATAGFARRWA